MMTGEARFSFCPKCGGKLKQRTVGVKARLVCSACGYIFYENPIVGVAVILQKADGRILLGRRAEQASYSGFWCIPCGYVEYDEEVRAAAKREFVEETGLSVELEGIFTVLSNFHNPETHTVGIWFKASAFSGTIQAGDDLDEVAWFAPDRPPALAFPTDQIVLEMLKTHLPSAEQAATGNVERLAAGGYESE